MTRWQGAYTALITPFSKDGKSVDHRRLTEQIGRQAEGGVRGVVPCGTTGEAPTLTDTEHERVIETTIAAAGPLGLTVIAGAGSNDTAHAIKLHRFAATAGADASLQVTPYYNKPTQEGLYRHFTLIADSADLPIVLYNIPGRSGVEILIETIERLSRHPNIQAIKEATGSIDLASRINQRTDLAILSGDDPLTLPLASVGAVGVISVLSNVVPDRVAALNESILGGDFDAALPRHEELYPLAWVMLKLDSNPVPVKAAMAWLGLDTGSVRLPLCAMPSDTRRTLVDILERHGLRAGELVGA